MPTIKRAGAKSNGRVSLIFVVLFVVTTIIVCFQADNGGLQEEESRLSLLPRTTEEEEYALAIPKGHARVLPSIRVQEAVSGRSIYGGKGDKKHLGGFTDIDTQGVSPSAWKWMVQRLNAKSVLDVGCGRGISTTWFLMHGLEALCVEGSHDARQNTMLPDPDHQMVEHDFSRGPWWPDQTYDVVWCVEFLEHVGRQFHHHYLPAFRKAAIVLVTHSIWGGWHHVEVHKEDWWKTKFELYGFRYSHDLSMAIRTQAWNETQNKQSGVAPNGKKLGAPHIHSKMLAFINPAVSALPKHAHLFYEPGCYRDRKEGVLYQRDCTEENETPLPAHFQPLKLTPEQDQAWFDWVQKRVKPHKGDDKK